MTELEFFTERIERLRAEVGKVLVGQRAVVDGVLACLVADGHVLLEGVPGLGKTLLVRTLAQCLGLTYRRIQFTPDLMPADIVGTHILNEDESGRRTMEFQHGPVWTQILLADEINRATPKTQSALLEAMQERQVTINGVSHPLPKPFFVMATQNPLEMEGTYPLPEAQLDRFFYKVMVPFPTLDELCEVMNRTTGNAHQDVQPVITPDELSRMRHTVREVTVVPEVMQYAMRVLLATHPDQPGGSTTAKQYLRYGASPRGAQTLILGGRVNALMAGREHVGFADIRACAVPALRHRVGRSFEAEAEGLETDRLIAKILDEVPEVTGAVARELHA
ncbi:MAG: AAA family ATPase [Alphaproteobacteria bacterium]|nr:AAA family ATPase [Alphaproteobacteria bacterium]